MMTRMVRRGPLLAALAGIALAGGGTPAQQAREFRAVVHPDNPVSELTVDELSSFFFKRATRWEDGSPVVPVDQPAGSRARQAFSEAVFGRSASAMVSYWQQQIFSGRGVPPTELADDEAVVRYVADHPGAVGYVSPTTALRGVKAVEVRR